MQKFKVATTIHKYPINRELKQWGFSERVKYWSENYLRIAAIDGLAHLVKPQTSSGEKFFWITCLFLVSIPVILIGGQAWNRYWYNPGVTTIERDHWQWTHTLPGITVCPRDYFFFDDESVLAVLNWFAAKGYNNSIPVNASFANDDFQIPDNRIEGFVRALFYSNLHDYQKLQQFRNEFAMIDPESYLELAHLLTSIGDPTTLELTFYDSEINFTKTITEFGVCFTFNSIIAEYDTSSAWKKDALIFEKGVKVIETQVGVAEPEVNLRSLQTENLIFLHSYNEIVTLQSKPFEVATQFMGRILAKTVRTWATSDYKGLTIAQRQCRYPDESNLKYSPVYSYNLCAHDCRAALMLRYCKCLQYNYKRMGSDKVCDIAGMLCLSNYADDLTELEKNGISLCPTKCLPNCEIETIEANYVDHGSWFTPTQFYVQLDTHVTYRLKKSVIFSSIDLVVQIGGLAGLSYGLSILSVIELVYFLILRFYWIVIRGRKYE